MSFVREQISGDLLKLKIFHCQFSNVVTTKNKCVCVYLWDVCHNVVWRLNLTSNKQLKFSSFSPHFLPQSYREGKRHPHQCYTNLYFICVTENNKSNLEHKLGQKIADQQMCHHGYSVGVFGFFCLFVSQNCPFCLSRKQLELQSWEWMQEANPLTFTLPRRASAPLSGNISDT